MRIYLYIYIHIYVHVYTYGSTGILSATLGAHKVWMMAPGQSQALAAWDACLGHARKGRTSAGAERRSGFSRPFSKHM